MELVRGNPRAWLDVRDPGSVEEIREAFGSRCWVPYMPHAGTFGYAKSDGCDDHSARVVGERQQQVRGLRLQMVGVRAGWPPSTHEHLARVDTDEAVVECLVGVLHMRAQHADA